MSTRRRTGDPTDGVVVVPVAGASRSEAFHQTARRTERISGYPRARRRRGLGGHGTPPALEAAQSAGLRYGHDRGPGIVRRRSGRGFTYIGPNRARITDPAEIERLAGLAIPPAWRDVWISPDPRGHLQATGRDARGRKQFRYHPRWRAVRDETKYERMLGFGEALPALRRRLERHLSLPGLPRAKVLATVARLLDRTFLRVGNEEYAKENGSYGLTTLRADHVDVSGSTVRFQFRGKGGRTHAVEVDDRRVAWVIRRCQDLPGQELFQYLDEAGERQTIDSADVNAYVRKASGQDFTAKDFRTWGASVLAAAALRGAPRAPSVAQGRRVIAAACRLVSDRLGNTPGICRKSYIHPGVIEAYVGGVLANSAALRVPPSAGLSADEAFLLAFLRAVAAATAQPHASGSHRRGAPRTKRTASRASDTLRAPLSRQASPRTHR